MIKTPPIAFTEDNFNSVIQGFKTETRRLFTIPRLPQTEVNQLKSIYPNGEGIKSRYQIGDRCYLTEPTQIKSSPDQSLHCVVKYFWNNPQSLWKDINFDDKTKIESRKTGIYSKQIARFMLKSFARYWVEITGVKPERLFDITDKAAIVEGVKSLKRPELACPIYFDYIKNEYLFADPKDSYISEIEMLHGKEIADSNPWLWVYKFKLCH